MKLHDRTPKKGHFFAHRTQTQAEVSDGKKPQHPAYLPEDKCRDHQKGKYDKEPEPHLKLLIDIFLEPFSTTVKRYKRLKFNPKYGNQFKNKLISQGLIQPRKIITAKGWITLYELTQKGKATLRDLGYDVKNLKEGIVHKFWKQKISDHYRRKGVKVLVEEGINGRPDIIVIDSAKKIAVEIETGKSDYIGNIKRALDAGFDEIICVATNRNVEEKIRQVMQNKGIEHERITIHCAQNLA